MQNVFIFFLKVDIFFSMKGFECLFLHEFQHTKTFDAILDGIVSSVAFSNGLGTFTEGSYDLC